jgi:Spy/CpxP family protein refolding chaperone
MMDSADGHGHGMGMGMGGKAKSENTCPILMKAENKAQYAVNHADEIGLSADQVQAIRAIQMDIEKLEIRQAADMKIGMLDLQTKLDQDPVDAAAVGAMIDQMSASFAQSAKTSLDTYMKLNAVLTPDQAAKLKVSRQEIKQEMKQDKHSH